MAIIGQWVQELLTGQGPIEQITAGHISPFGDGQGLFCKYLFYVYYYEN